MRYFNVDEILIIAEDQVNGYQLLKEDQLEYLVEVVSAKIGEYELYPSIFQKAAVYAHHIITGHLFLDGNKRIGMHCALLFLDQNGCELRDDINNSIIEMGLSIARGKISDIDLIAQELQSWVL